MENKSIYIVFHKTNEKEATTIFNDLQQTGLDCQLINSGDYKDDLSFAKAIAAVNGRGLFLLSDTFLKSETCLKGNIIHLYERINNKQLLPIIVDGRYGPEDNRGPKLVATKLSKMGHVFEYMSYWQEEYLKARKKIRLATPDNRSIYEKKLATVKAISSNIPDFLKYLKDQDCIYFEAFRQQKYQAFFQHFGIVNNLENWVPISLELATQKIEEKDSFEPGRGSSPDKSTNDKNANKAVADSISPIWSEKSLLLPNLAEVALENNVESIPLEEQNFQAVGDLPTPEITSIAVPVLAIENEVTQENYDLQEAIEFQKQELEYIPSDTEVVDAQIVETSVEEEILTIETPITKSIEAEVASTNVIANDVIVDTLIPTKISSSYVKKEIKEPITSFQTSPIRTFPRTDNSILPIQEEDKIILIMGATTPIGQAVVDVFANNGYRIILTGNRYSQLFKMRMQMQERYQKEVCVLPFDPNIAISMDMAMEDLKGKWQDINILLNISDFSTIPTPEENWNQILNTTITALYNITNKIAPFLARQKNGHVINIAAIDKQLQGPTIAQALQQTIESFTQTIQVDLQKDNTMVSQLFPQISSALTPDTAKAIGNIIYFMTNQPEEMTITKISLAEKGLISNGNG